MGKGSDSKQVEHSRSWQQRLRRGGAIAIATGGGVGLLPLAPGTWGSMVGAGLWWFFGGNVFITASLILFFSISGLWATQVAIRLFKKTDPGQVVVDEVIGILITLIGMPPTVYWLVFGFVLFRIFDVLKPAPANLFDNHSKKSGGGFSVIMDDVIAGFYASLILHFVLMAQL